MNGILYGIGIGPGDPELLTLKAVRYIKACPVIAIPHKDKDACVAYQIALGAVPEIADKPCLCLPMPMTKDPEVLEQSHRRAVEQVEETLLAGKDIALLTLGDCTVYSTSLYINERIKARGFETRLINGITSFCAAAARLNIPLVNGAEELHIIPASYQIEEALALPGVKVLMKSGRQISKVKETLKRRGSQVMMVERCGMEGERIYHGADEIPEDAGYYSLMIVRDGMMSENN